MKIKTNKNKRQLILGWTAVAVVTLIASAWSFWGGIENFHEGWYSPDIWENIFMMFIQYWSFAIVFITIGLIGIRFSRVALFLCIAVGIAAVLIFSGAAFSVLWLMIIFPLAGIGLLFFFGRARPRWLAYTVVAAIPVIILLVTSILGIVKISARLDDGNYGQRTVQTESICLVWAPRGPGWPDRGVGYDEAKGICSHLNEDGTGILEEEVNIWRLPTLEEAVSSQMIHGESAGGVWDPENKKASYDKTPDKETPLWDPNSKVIYYWTDTIESAERAYIIVYDGGIFSKRKQSRYGYLSFRAVKDCIE